MSLTRITRDVLAISLGLLGSGTSGLAEPREQDDRIDRPGRFEPTPKLRADIEAVVRQSGNDSLAFIDQRDISSTGRGQATIDDEGRNNTARAIQRGGGTHVTEINLLGNHANSASAGSSASINDARAQTAELRADGEVVQKGTGENRAIVTTTGDGSAFGVTQDHTGDLGANVAEIAQRGFANTAVVYQAGSGNDADIDQNADNGVAKIYQDGDSNEAKIEQKASAHNPKSLIVQKGDGGDVTHIQETPNPNGPVVIAPAAGSSVTVRN